MIARAFREAGHDVDEYARIYQTNDWIQPRVEIIGKEYDVFLFMECGDGEPQYPELTHIISAKYKFGWFFDIELNPSKYAAICNDFRFDRCFLANPDYANIIPCPVTYLPYAADKDHFYRSLNWHKTRDVVLVGEDRDSRRHLIEILRGHGINAELITGVFKKDYIDVLASSKMVINDTAGGGSNLLSMRTFEAPAAGSLLVQYDAPCLKTVFEPGVHCVTYNTYDSLVDVVRYAFAERLSYERIRKDGQDHVLRHHTYDIRAMEILSQCR